MFDLVNGLPVHPLVVHAVVVLLPLACLGSVAIAVRPAWRERYGLLVVGCGVVAAVLLPVATSSGEELQGRVGSAGEHADLGETLIWFAIPLVLLSAALVWLDRRQRPTTGESGGATTGAETVPDRAGLVRTVAVLAVVAALATTVQTYRVGDSGARAAWGDRVAGSSQK